MLRSCLVRLSDHLQISEERPLHVGAADHGFTDRNYAPDCQGQPGARQKTDTGGDRRKPGAAQIADQVGKRFENAVGPSIWDIERAHIRIRSFARRMDEIMRRGEIGLYLLSLRAALVGGNWNNSTNAGVFALNLNNSPTNTNNNIGFRVAKQSGFSQNRKKYFLPSVLFAFGDAILVASGSRSAKHMNWLAGDCPCQPSSIL